MITNDLSDEPHTGQRMLRTIMRMRPTFHGYNPNLVVTRRHEGVAAADGLVEGVVVTVRHGKYSFGKSITEVCFLVTDNV